MKYIIGVDLGGTNLRIGLFNSDLSLLDKAVVSTQKFKNKDQLIQGIITSIQTILIKNSLQKGRVLGIGLGLPGPIDYRRQIVYFFPNIKGWRNVPLGRILRKALGIDIFMDNDANLICLAESKLGVAKKQRNLVCITLGTGVGGGLIIENKLYRGSNYVAGELGHIPINEKGRHCNCGGRGCLESYVGNLRIMKEAKRIFKRDVSLEELSRMAKLNNKKAIAVWKKTGERIGIALSGVINLINPSAVVVAGGVSKAGRVLLDSIRQTIQRRAMPIQARGVRILNSRLKGNAGMMGAAILVKMESKNV